jgi:hypothetical protein
LDGNNLIIVINYSLVTVVVTSLACLDQDDMENELTKTEKIAGEEERTERV